MASFVVVHIFLAVTCVAAHAAAAHPVVDKSASVLVSVLVAAAVAAAETSCSLLLYYDCYVASFVDVDGFLAAACVATHAAAAHAVPCRCWWWQRRRRRRRRLKRHVHCCYIMIVIAVIIVALFCEKRKTKKYVTRSQLLPSESGVNK